MEQLRYEKYNQLVTKGTFKPDKLPPTTGAAVQHALRAYLQYRDWLLLESQSLDPIEYGWAYTDAFEPVGSLEPIAPESILKFITCKCQIHTTEESCENNRCTCRKYGVPCIPACGKCHGLNCSNSPAQQDEKELMNVDTPDQEDT